MNALNTFSRYAHWLPRLGLASIFLYHGIIKFGNLGGMADMMGMPILVIALLGGAEVLGGALILAGGFGQAWATRAAAAIFAAVMIGAIPVVHWSHGWNSIGSMGMEFQVLILTLSLYFLARGNESSLPAAPLAAA